MGTVTPGSPATRAEAAKAKPRQPAATTVPPTHRPTAICQVGTGESQVKVNDPANPHGQETYPLEIPPDTAPGERFRLPRQDPFEGGFVTVRVKVRNTALLGAASIFTPLSADSFAEALRKLSPRGTYDANQVAFDVGRDLASRQLMEVSHVE